MVSDAYRFIVPLLVLALLALYLNWLWFFGLFLALAMFVCYFFRNPKRTIPAGEGLIVSPADGRIVQIAALPERDGERGGHAVSIFLSVFDVHVNRSPIAGELERLEYRRGRFKPAYDDVASSINEQNVLTIRGNGNSLVVKQIAGLIARRVICWKKPGAKMERGELIGLIRFGSRVDMLLPRQVKVLVKVGDRVKGGSSIIGEFA